MAERAFHLPQDTNQLLLQGQALSASPAAWVTGMFLVSSLSCSPLGRETWNATPSRTHSPALAAIQNSA